MQKYIRSINPCAVGPARLGGGARSQPRVAVSLAFCLPHLTDRKRQWLPSARHSSCWRDARTRSASVGLSAMRHIFQASIALCAASGCVPPASSVATAAGIVFDAELHNQSDGSCSAASLRHRSPTSTTCRSPEQRARRLGSSLERSLSSSLGSSHASTRARSRGCRLCVIDARHP